MLDCSAEMSVSCPSPADAILSFFPPRPCVGLGPTSDADSFPGLSEQRQILPAKMH